MHSGAGLLNTVMHKIPMPELHMGYKKGGENVPGGSFNKTKKYSYCGPGTKLEKRMNEGYKGVNSLNQACRVHDIAYATNKDTKSRNIADDVLAAKASQIVLGSADLEERADAKLITAIMAVKSKFGMGL
jgi:hypothetical protein